MTDKGTKFALAFLGAMTLTAVVVVAGALLATAMTEETNDDESNDIVELAFGKDHL